MTKVQAQRERDFRALIVSLRQYRLEQNLTYRELATAIGLGHSRVFVLLNDPEPRLNDRTRYRVEAFAQRVGLLEKVAS